ncbi:37 kDa salivary gland allergen Aed a 2-like isoform X2 [Armigeres subalbatus]|uniref:37 kDa salivary gland allergen Aed a 2-like isoform X2 n=1 Tax=Armigeres subalbatus TaxID=124917 RepID=UPI002ED6487E
MSLTVRNLSPFSGICALLWMLGIAASVEAVAESLDPEETSFVFTRSIEQHAGGIESDGDIRVERILNWTRWEFSELAVDQKTSCFVRDLLSRLKLLDVDSGRFQGPQIKQPRQSVFEYCENKFYKHKRDVRCAARNYVIPDDEDFHRHMDCIFRGLHYFDKQGNLDVNEILHDFHLVGKTHLANDILHVLRSCSVNSDFKALSYYECLIKSDFIEQFKEALDYREIRSSDYYYTLKNPMPIYERNRVQHHINSVNREFCLI